MAKKKGVAGGDSKGAAEEPKRGRGRPKLDDPNRVPLNMRVSHQFREAAEAYQAAKEHRTLSEAVRDAAEKTFKQEGLLK